MSGPVVIVPAGDLCGEGLCVIGAHVYWTDINRFLIHRHDPATATTRSWQFDEPVVALAPTEDDDELLVALASRLVFWRPATGESRAHGFALHDYPAMRLNDGRAGPDGRFWIGSMANNVAPDGRPLPPGPPDGKLYAVESGDAQILAEGIGIPNTLCWDTGRGRFYFADSLRNEIYRYRLGPDGKSIADRQVHFGAGVPGLPDGSAMDDEGGLWNCRYGGGQVVRIGPDGGVTDRIALPVSNVTTCAFGGAGGRTLYITSAASPPDVFERHAGAVFAVETPYRGVACHVVRP